MTKREVLNAMFPFLIGKVLTVLGYLASIQKALRFHSL